MLSLLVTLALTAAPAKPVAAPPAAPAASPPASTTTAAPKQRSGIKIIEIDPAKRGDAYYVSASPSTKTVFQFPEAWATTPICGDCIIGDEQPTSQLWRLDLIPETNSVVLNAIRRPGPTLSENAFKTNLDVTLKSGLSIVIRIDIVLPDLADTRVQFVMPGASTAEAILAKERERLEGEFAKRAQETAMQRLLDLHMRGTTCRDFAGRPTRTDLMVVRLKQLCKTAGLLYITFEVENRGGDDLQIANASLVDRSIASTYVRFERPRLRAGERTLGIAAADLADEPPPSVYTLTLEEDGGRDRSITVDGIDF